VSSDHFVPPSACEGTDGAALLTCPHTELHGSVGPLVLPEGSAVAPLGVSEVHDDNDRNAPAEDGSLSTTFLGQAGSPFLRGLPTFFVPGGFFDPLGRPRPRLGGSDIVRADVEGAGSDRFVCVSTTARVDSESERRRR
jgi:hypothetical protein